MHVSFKKGKFCPPLTPPQKKKKILYCVESKNLSCNPWPTLYSLQWWTTKSKTMINKTIPLAAGDQSIAKPSWLCCVSTWTTLTCLGLYLLAASESSTIAVCSVMSWMYTEPTSDQVAAYTFPSIFATWDWNTIQILFESSFSKTETFNSLCLIIMRQ